MSRKVIGKLRATYSTWGKERLLMGRPQQTMYRGVLMDDEREWWSCSHEHASGSQATRCADEELGRATPT
jgi:hypothetical protein